MTGSRDALAARMVVLRDIRNTRRIHAVVVRGRVIGPAERQRMLAEAEAAAHEPVPAGVAVARTGGCCGISGPR